jgi:hypothetical protein
MRYGDHQHGGSANHICGRGTRDWIQRAKNKVERRRQLTASVIRQFKGEGERLIFSMGVLALVIQYM